MEKPSHSNFNKNSVPGRRIPLILVTPRPALSPPPSSSSSTIILIPSSSSSDNPPSGSPRGVVPGANPKIRMPYHFIFRISDTRNEVLQPPAPVHPQPPSIERHISRIPTAPRLNPSLEAGTSQPQQRFGGRLYSAIIREAMAKIPLFSEEKEESHSPSSSSSLRFGTKDDGDESDGAPNGKRRGKTFDEIPEEVIRDMREAEEAEGLQPREMAEVGEPS